MASRPALRPCRTLATSTCSRSILYTTTNGNGVSTGSRVPETLPKRPRRGKDSRELIPSKTFCAIRMAAEGLCARIYETIAAKSAAASGDQRFIYASIRTPDFVPSGGVSLRVRRTYLDPAMRGPCQPLAGTTCRDRDGWPPALARSGPLPYSIGRQSGSAWPQVLA